jgi:hypothetical protein
MIWAQTSRDNNAQPGQGKKKMSPACRPAGAGEILGVRGL